MTYISVKEAAKIIGKNERTIRRWIKSGQIKHVLIKGKFHLVENNIRGIAEKNKKKKIKIKKTDEIEGKNVQMISELSNMDKSKYPDKMSEKMSRQSIYGHKKHTIWPIDSRENNNLIMEEDVEYYLGKKMSDNAKNNMSVNKIDEEYIGPLISQNDTVEMSNYSKNEMSESTNSAIKVAFGNVTNRTMSDFFGSLSTNSDSTVDNLFDSDDKIVSLNRNIFGHSEKYSGHLDRTLGMSAFAVRIIEEKDKMSRKYQEENEWLKNEIIGLKNEILNFRREIVDENMNRTKLSDFLIESNKSWQERGLKYIETYNGLKNTNETQQNRDEIIFLIQKLINEKEKDKQNQNFSQTFWVGWTIMFFGICILIFILLIQNWLMTKYFI